MSLLGGIQDVSLLTEEHITSVCYIFRNLGSCTPVFNSETCIRAIIRLKDNLWRLLIISAMWSLPITSNCRVAEWGIILHYASILSIRIRKPVHLICLGWAQLKHLAVLIFWRNRSYFTISFILLSLKAIRVLYVTEFRLNEVFANNHIREIAYSLVVFVHQGIIAGRTRNFL